jgi:hypothetical protein
MIQFAAILLLALPPRIHNVPDALKPYVHRLRGESEVVRWLLDHRSSQRPLTEMVQDPSLSITTRQKVWQAKRKIESTIAD